MKKIFIGSLVGGIILFACSFVIWGLTPIHLHTFMYTPVQDSILKVLADNQVETGAYFMPMVDNRNVHGMDSKYREECEKQMKEDAGKPMATLYYLKDGMKMDAGTMIRALLFNFLAVLAACILLAPAFASTASFFGRWWLLLIVGLLLSVTGPLMSYNWMGVPWSFTLDMILDTFLNWSVTGLWLAWYFRN